MRFQATRKGRGRCGMVLPLVLVIVGALALLVYHLQVSAQVSNSRANQNLDRARLRIAAREAVWLALKNLAADPDNAVDHTNETWAAGLNMNYPDAIAVQVKVEDEERRLNLNNLAVPALPENRSSFQAISDALAGLGRNDADALTRSLKNRLALSGGSAHESLSELKRLLGAESKAWQNGALNFTVLPTSPARATTINVNTAPIEILEAVLGPGWKAAARAINDLRQERPLASLGPLSAALGPGAQEKVRLLFDVQSRYFSISARSSRNGQFEDVYALAERDDHGTVRVIRWVER